MIQEISRINRKMSPKTKEKKRIGSSKHSLYASDQKKKKKKALTKIKKTETFF